MMELFPPGTILDGSTKIISLIGEGGLGSVYKAEQAELNRMVAVKVLHFSALSDPENRMRFEREARILSSFTSNNVVSVYSFGVLPKRIWLVAVAGSVLCLATALPFFLQNSGKNTSPEFHGLSATTNGRASDTLRAEQLLGLAQGLKSAGKIEPAIQLVTRALGTIDRSYQSSGRSESASKKDLAILQNAAEICKGIDIKDPTEVDGPLGRIEGNDILTLSFSDQSKFHVAEARLCTSFKKSLEASRHYHAAIGTALQTGDPANARTILQEAEKALRPTHLPIPTLYLQMAKVLIESNEKHYAEAEKSYKAARNLLDECYPKGDEDRNRVLGMFIQMDAAIGNMPRANQTLDEVFAIAQEIHDGKYKPYMVERRLVAYGSRRCCADALDSLIVTEGLLEKIEPLRVRARAEVLRYRKELDTLNRESP